MKLNETAFAKAHAAIGAGAYLICILVVILAPNLYLGIMDSWIHGLDVSNLPRIDIRGGELLLGLVTFTAAAALWGWATASIYNHLLKS